MSDSNDVEAIEKISTEIGDSQIRITLSSQCIKAQAFLVDKLRKQTERQKEICSFINSSNLKLKTELKQAELEIKSLLIAQGTILSANIELKKEYLLCKERRSEIGERVRDGEKRYEQLWLQAKSRYESLPFVQRLLQAQNKTKSLEENIIELKNKREQLKKEIKAKRQQFIDMDRKVITSLAEYVVIDLPNNLKKFQEKTKAINKISKEIDCILKDQSRDHIITPMNMDTPTIRQNTESNVEKSKIVNTDDGWFNIYQNIDRESIKMPEIQFLNSDFDVLNAKWDKIKTKKDEIEDITTFKRFCSGETDSETHNKNAKIDDDFSVYFKKPDLDTDNNDQKNSFNKKKLINILDDVKLDQKETYDILTKINSDQLKDVDKIGEDNPEVNIGCKDIDMEQENEEIEEIDLTKRSQSILVPPSQFLDYTQDNINRHQQVEVVVQMSNTSPGIGKEITKENTDKKKVSFDLTLSMQEMTNNVCDVIIPEGNNANDTLNSQNDISLVSDESYTNIKEMILRKHNLDLSPQFVYAKAKNTTLQTNKNEKIITSKFFQMDNDEQGVNMAKVTDIIPKESDTNEPNENIKDDNNLRDDNPNNLESDILAISSPKINSVEKSDKQVTGFLFNHGTQGIPDSLNVSISTTGYDEGDGDFPHFIDSALLLSPKADVSIHASGDNAEITSQEVPNFLSGLRKTGFLFFGQSSGTDSKPETSNDTNNQSNNFNFNFGGGEKKTRGGLFNMFR